jgi:uncharacterized membrane protein
VTPEEYLLSLGLSKELVVFLIATLPIVELRGAIPLAINVLDIHWVSAFLLAFVGNLLPVPFILLFIDSVTKGLNKIAFFKRLLDWLFERTRRQGWILDRYKRIGLVLFVAVPLPVTGAWTGSLLAVLFGIPFKHAFLSIVIGVIIAGAIITSLSLLGWAGAIIAGIALSTLAVSSLWRLKD